MKSLSKICCLIFLLFLSHDIYAQKSVNALTWWGYLEPQWVQDLIYKKCETKITFDTYNSNEEMLRKWNANKNKYDVIIFSQILYPSIKKDIKINQSNLYKNSFSYNRIIKNHYMQSHFPHNIAYFFHSFTGFLWNPDKIELSETDTLKAIFFKAKTNKVILLDDPYEIELLLKADAPSQEAFSLENLKTLSQVTQLFISNEINQIYSQKDFAFSYFWSGAAESNKLSMYKYKFVVNKHLSHISTDLIAQTSSSPKTACVANLLSSNEFLSHLAEERFYFTPYAHLPSHSANKTYQKLYEDFINKLPTLQWAPSISAKRLQQINTEWEKIKYELTKDDQRH